MVKLFALLFGVIIFVSCLITPIIFSSIAIFWPSFPWPYSRVFDRVVLAVTIVTFLLARKRLRISRPAIRPREFLQRHGRELVIGLVFSLIGSAIALGASISFGTLAWGNPEVSRVIVKLLQAVGTAAVVSILEEAIFRAILYRQLALQMGHLGAALLSSLIYAVVHFIVPDKGFVYPGWSFFIGFEYLGEIVGRLASDGVVQGIFGLILVGLVLAESVRRTGALAMAIGLHAGWIIALKSSLFLTVVPEGVTFAEGVGRRYFFVAAPATWVSVLVVGMLVVLTTRKRSITVN